VFDANVYVAAYLSRNPRSPNKELFPRWRDHQFLLLVSKAVLKEVVEKFGELGIDQQLTVELVAHILADAEYVHVSEEDSSPSSLQTLTMTISLPVLWWGEQTTWSPMIPISIVLVASIRA